MNKQCKKCGNRIHIKRIKKHEAKCGTRKKSKATVMKPEESEPDWQTKCLVCDQVPTLPITGMCGPCTFGEADTAGGNW